MREEGRKRVIMFSDVQNILVEFFSFITATRDLRHVGEASIAYRLPIRQDYALFVPNSQCQHHFLQAQNKRPARERKRMCVYKGNKRKEA